MAFYSQQFAATASMAPLTQSWIDTSMINAGWTFIESLTGPAGGSVANVYKSAASANSIGMDFYVATYRGGAVNAILFRLFEQWDSVNKLALKYAPSATRATQVAVNPIDQTVVDTVGLPLNSSSLNGNVFLQNTTTITQFYADIDVNRIIIGSSNQSAIQPIYAGIYDTLCKPQDDTEPLVIANFKGTAAPAQTDANSGQGGASTREPTTPPTASGNFLIQLHSPQAAPTAIQTYSHALSNTNSPNQIGSIYRGVTTSEAARIQFVSSRTLLMGTIANNYRGVFKDVLTAPSTALTQGDTLAVTDDSGSVRNYVNVNPVPTNAIGIVYIRTS